LLLCLLRKPRNVKTIRTSPELITIDLDGTLVDSVADLHAAVVLMQHRLKQDEATLDEVKAWVGNGIDRLVHRALTSSMHSDAEQSLFNTALKYFKDAYDKTNGEASTVLLKKLDIDRYFSLHLAGDDVAGKKPAPDALLQAARHVGASTDRSIMIGDSLSDIKAARAAGFKMLSVSYGYNHGTSVHELGPKYPSHAIVDSFSEIVDVVYKLIKND